MAMAPAAISASPAVTTSELAVTAPESPAASANGTVSPSDIPMTTSRTVSPPVKCVSTCRTAGMGRMVCESTAPVSTSARGGYPSRHPVSHDREAPPVPGFRPVPRTGVIYVMTEAARKGWTQSDAAWANLGQGMPETGALPGGPARVERLAIDPADLEYAPVPGIRELREAVA